jgi:PAS domain S-box-containing protein
MSGIKPSNFSVLYVDDEPDILDIGKRFLENEGDIAIETSESAITALKKLKYEMYDAVVSDYEMPYMDGISFLKTVKKEYNIPFILLTGKGREEVVIEGINNGLDFYFEKEGDPKKIFMDLSFQLKTLIQRKKREDQIRESEEIYRGIFDDQPEAIVRINPDFSIDCANRAALTILQLQSDGLIGTNLLSLFKKKDQKHFLECVKNLTTEKPFGTCEIQINRCSSNNQLLSRWIQWTFFALFDSLGTIQKLHTTGRDITNEKDLENKDLTRFLNILFLQKIAMDFIRIEDENELYLYIVERINSLVPNSYVGICSIDKETRELILICGFSQEEGYSDIISPFINYLNQTNSELPFNNIIQKGTLVKIHAWKPKISPLSESFLNTDNQQEQSNFYLIGLIYLGKISGVILINVPDYGSIENWELIESFSDLAAEAIFWKKSHNHSLNNQVSDVTTCNNIYK